MPKAKIKQRPADASPLPSASHASGLWRDGSLLVVDLTAHYFPRRCLISNRPVEGPQAPVTLTCHRPPYLEVQRLESDRRQLGDATIRIISAPKSGTRVEFDMQLPLTPRWRQLKSATLGTRLLFGALAMLAFILVSQLIVQRLELSGQFLALWSWIALVALVVSGILIILLQSLLLPVYRLEERKIWIAGVHREWLKGLPGFVPSRGMLERSIRSLLWRKWSSLALCIVLWALAAFAWFSTRPPEATTNTVIAVFAMVSLAAAIFGIYSHYAAAKQRRRLTELFPERRRRGRKR